MKWITERRRRLRGLLAAVLLGLGVGLSAAPPVSAARPAHRPTGSRALPPGARSPARQHARAAAAGAKRRKTRKRSQPILTGNPARALASFEAMQRQYSIAGSGLYDGEPFSFLWPFSQALAATVSVANIPHLPSGPAKELREQLRERLTGLNDYLDRDNSGAPEGTYVSTLPAFDGTVAPPAGPGGPKYYDDNDWVGIELVRLYQLTRSAAFLGSAEGIMAFEMTGWQESSELACPGGVPFSNLAENNERNTVTTAPAAELGALLYRYTHNAAYLSFAVKAYDWVRSCLLESNGMYADHINRRGVLSLALWSYNQGSMIGAGTLLYQATGSAGYLYQARQTAQAARSYFTSERLGSENPFFVAVYFRNLLYLDSVTHDPPGGSVAQAYVNYAWEHERVTGDVFVFGSPATGELLDQAAVVQIYALLASPASTYF